MLSKLLSDSSEFFAAAKREWDEAARLAKEAEGSENEHPADTIVLPMSEEPARIAIESALSVAAMNYTTSIELLLKGFIGVNERFSEQSLGTMKGISHKSRKVLGRIPDEWAMELERLYAASDVARVEVAVLWNWWNPPQGKWIEDTKRLNCRTLEEFLQFLEKEKMQQERYSFQEFAGSDFRVKIVRYEKLEVLHNSIEGFLCAEATKKGWWKPGMRVVLTTKGEGSRVLKVRFPTRRARFELDKQGRQH